VDGGQDRADAEALYALLETDVAPLFRERDAHGLPVKWCERIKSSVRNLVPFFNTHRMVGEYVRSAYLPAHADAAPHD
jgi:starch phosphorylase